MPRCAKCYKITRFSNGSLCKDCYQEVHDEISYHEMKAGRMSEEE